MKTAVLEPLPPALDKILATLLATTDIIQYNKVIRWVFILHQFLMGNIVTDLLAIH